MRSESLKIDPNYAPLTVVKNCNSNNNNSTKEIYINTLLPGFSYTDQTGATVKIK